MGEVLIKVNPGTSCAVRGRVRLFLDIGKCFGTFVTSGILESLFAVGHQLDKLFGCQITPLTKAQIAKRNIADGNALQTDDLQSHLLAHFTDLAVSTFIKLHLQCDMSIVLIENRNRNGTDRRAVNFQR